MIAKLALKDQKVEVNLEIIADHIVKIRQGIVKVKLYFYFILIFFFN